MDKNQIKKNLVFALVLFFSIAGIISFLAVLHNGMWGSHDITYHLCRIQGMADAWKSGQFPASIFPNSLNGYGYSAIFYPNLFFVLPAFLCFMGINVEIAYLIFLTLVIFITTYLAIKISTKFTKNIKISYLSGILTTLFPYVLINLFVRSAVGEYLGILFGLLVVLALFNMVKEDFSKPYLLLIGMLGLLYSHMISLCIVGVFAVVVVLVNIKKLLKQKHFLMKVCLVFVAFVLLGLGFVLPFLEIYKSGNFGYMIPWITVDKSALNLLQYKSFNSIRICLAIEIIIIISMRLFVTKNKENASSVKKINILFAVLCCLFVSLTCVFPWWLLKNTIVNIIQFPWRLSVLISILFPIFSTLCLENYAETKYCRKTAVRRVVISVLFVLSVSNSLCYAIIRGQASLNYNSVGAGEWVPLSEEGLKETYLADTKELIQDVNIYNNLNGIVEYERNKNSVTINFQNNSEDEYYILPIFYYKGYKAEIIDENNISHELNVETDSNMKIKIINANCNGTIKLTYCETTIQKISYLISFSSLGICVAYVLIYVIIKKKRKKTHQDIQV